MGSFLRLSALALLAILAALLIRRVNPEMSWLLELASVVVILLLGARLFSGLDELRALAADSFGVSALYLRPLLKCAAASFATKLTSDLCRDASHTAAASAVELAGSLCSLGIVMPLLITMLKTIGEIL